MTSPQVGVTVGLSFSLEGGKAEAKAAPVCSTKRLSPTVVYMLVFRVWCLVTPASSQGSRVSHCCPEQFACHCR